MKYLEDISLNKTPMLDEDGRVHRQVEKTPVPEIDKNTISMELAIVHDDNRSPVFEKAADGTLHLKKEAIVHFPPNYRKLLVSEDRLHIYLKSKNGQYVIPQVEAEAPTKASIRSKQSSKYYDHVTQVNVVDATEEPSALLDQETDNLHSVQLDEIGEMIKRGEIRDANTIATLFRLSLQGILPIESYLIPVLYNLDAVTLPRFPVDDGESGYARMKKEESDFEFGETTQDSPTGFPPRDRLIPGTDPWISIKTDPQSGEVSVVAGDEASVVVTTDKGRFAFHYERSPGCGFETFPWIPSGAKESQKSLGKVRKAINSINAQLADFDHLTGAAEVSQEMVDLTNTENIQFAKLGETHPIPQLTTNTELQLVSGVPEDKIGHIDGKGDEPLPPAGFFILEFPQVLKAIRDGILTVEGKKVELDDRLVVAFAFLVQKLNTDETFRETLKNVPAFRRFITQARSTNLQRMFVGRRRAVRASL